jgi:hypothetical protein
MCEITVEEMQDDYGTVAGRVIYEMLGQSDYDRIEELNRLAAEGVDANAHKTIHEWIIESWNDNSGDAAQAWLDKQPDHLRNY